VEVLSVIQARKALERADVAILVIDGETGPVDQDEKIAGLIEDSGAAVVIAVNKWDTQRGKVGFDRNDAAKMIRKKMGFLAYAPILFTVARNAKGFDGLGELLADILEQRRVQIPTHEFSEWVRKEAEIHNPRNARFYLSHPTGRNPPSFVCRVDHAEKVHFSLSRHLVNAIREKWGFMGSPVRLKIIDRESAK
jgi:GTP-binding protein